MISSSVSEDDKTGIQKCIENSIKILKSEKLNFGYYYYYYYYFAEKEILLRAEESYNHLSTWKPTVMGEPSISGNLSQASDKISQWDLKLSQAKRISLREREKKQLRTQEKSNLPFICPPASIFFSLSSARTNENSLSLSRSFSRAGWSSETDKRKGSKRRKPWIPFSFLISFLLHLPFARCPRSPTSADLLLAFSLLALFLPSASVDLSDLLLQRPRAVP